MDSELFSIANLLKNYPNRVHVIWYSELLKNPQATLNAIYDFLEVIKFDNDFDNIARINQQNDLAAYGISGLHNVRKKLKGSEVNVEDYLSDYIIGKYKNALDFLLEENFENVY